jgi:hypothetical protein
MYVNNVMIKKYISKLDFSILVNEMECAYVREVCGLICRSTKRARCTQCASHIELPLGKSSGHSMKVREYKYELDCRRKECVEMNCERL